MFDILLREKFYPNEDERILQRGNVRSTVICDVNSNFSMLISPVASSARSTCIIRLLVQLHRDRAALYEQFMRSSPPRSITDKSYLLAETVASRVT